MRAIHKLTASDVLKAPEGMHGDGGGLYLSVKGDGRSWLFRYQSPVTKAERWMGLGSALYPDLAKARAGLAEVRDKADQCRRLVREGKDPKAERDTSEARSAAAAVTFRQAAEQYVAANAPGWRNPKHRDQWRNTLASYVYPQIGELAVAAVDTEAVLRVLTPIWHTKPETARRVRGRIEVILDAAAARGWRGGENPALWRGHLARLLPARGKAAPVRHHAAVAWREVGQVMAALQQRSSTAPIALRFLILTAARSGEVRGATWREIDLEAAVWTIPAERMKAGRPHRVPLSEPALAILREMDALRGVERRQDSLVFPGQKRGKPLSDAALSGVVKQVAPGATVHGFRSSFRDWCAETGHPRELAEQALAHTVGDKTEAAYFRSDLFQRRRALTADWAAHCLQPVADSARAQSSPARPTEGAAIPHAPDAAAARPALATLPIAVSAPVHSEYAWPEEARPHELLRSSVAAAGDPTNASAASLTAWQGEDYRFVSAALFLPPESLAVGVPRDYEGRKQDIVPQIPLFGPDDAKQLLENDPKVKAHWQVSPPGEMALRSWAYQFDQAIAVALAAARKVARGAPEQFATACERFGGLAANLLEALQPPTDDQAAKGTPGVHDILVRGAVPAVAESEDTARLQALAKLAAEVAAGHAEIGGESGRQNPIAGAIAPALADTARLLRFLTMLAERAKLHPLPETRLANKTNFERAFLQVLFEQLTMIFDVTLQPAVPPRHLAIRDTDMQPRGLATVLAKDLIHLAAERIPPRLASNPVWPPAADGRHPAIEALKKAAALGDFAIASRLKKARAARAERSPWG